MNVDESDCEANEPIVENYPSNHIRRRFDPAQELADSKHLLEEIDTRRTENQLWMFAALASFEELKIKHAAVVKELAELKQQHTEQA